MRAFLSLSQVSWSAVFGLLLGCAFPYLIGQSAQVLLEGGAIVFAHDLRGCARVLLKLSIENLVRHVVVGFDATFV